MIQLNIFGQDTYHRPTRSHHSHSYWQRYGPFRFPPWDAGLTSRYNVDRHSDSIKFAKCRWCGDAFTSQFVRMHIVYLSRTTGLQYSRTTACGPCSIHRSVTVGAKKSAAYRWLKTLPCSDCGIVYTPAVMEFDHDTDTHKKMGEVSSMVNGSSLGAFIDEIEKCDVVCANCHNIRTAARRARR